VEITIAIMHEKIAFTGKISIFKGKHTNRRQH